jgi:hypothetical protein
MTEIVSYELFPEDAAGPVVPPPLPAGRAAELAGLSPGARRTRRRLWDIEAGINPLTKLPLHPNAPTDATAKDRYLRDWTCGTCRFKMTVTVGNKTVAKCRKATTWSEYSDLRNWLPACQSYVKSA